jgi:hypothetical protein
VTRTFAIVLVLGIAQAAHADDRSLAREHYMKGTKAFDLGAFDEAIAEYQLAYRLRDDPALLYNLGQAHRLAGHAAEATRFYKVYLNKVPGASNRAEVEAKLAELQRLVDQQAKTRSMPPDQVKPPASVTETTPAPPPAPVERPAPIATPAAPEPAPAARPPANVLVDATVARDRRAGRVEKIAGVTLLAFGVASLAAGAACLALAKQNADALTALDRGGKPFDPGKESSGKAENAAGLALVGVGAAAAVVGTIVAAVGFRHARRTRSLAFAPLIAPRTAGATLEVRF